jgi:predicted  nucleic acid-binding Zn-ribbon protein
MSNRWDDLLIVQEHDTRVDQILHRQETLPERAELDKVMAQVSAVEAEAAEVEGRRHELGRAQQRIEDEIGSLGERASAHDKQLYSGTIANPRELQSLQDEIAALKRRIGQLEDQELEVMEQIEPLDADLARLTADRAELDERGGALRVAIAEAEVALEDELAVVRTERDAAASAVDPDLLAEYGRLRSRAGGIAIARLVGAQCGGCHLSLPAVEVARIKRLPGDEPVHCEECGRLLAR